MIRLPYQDTKPQGAADFYFAINATFRFIRQRFGDAGLIEYWQDLGANYFKPVTEIWQKGGLKAVAGYWKAFFAAEPGAEVEVTLAGDHVGVQIHRCPAIAHLRAHKREIDAGFCQHCHYVSQAIGSPAGIGVRVEGGNGSCRQTFFTGAEKSNPEGITSCA